jgi:hypothetical protein
MAAIIRLAAFITLGVTLMANQSAVSGARGDMLFHGREALSGRIRGHDDDLPSEALRCSNCHEAKSGKSAGVIAPHIDRALLLESRQRRRGPPSHYDAASFCKMLRTGVDPVFVVVAREMPVFNLDEGQCNSLWMFLTEERKPK